MWMRSCFEFRVQGNDTSQQRHFITQLIKTHLDVESTYQQINFMIYSLQFKILFNEKFSFFFHYRMLKSVLVNCE
jgi:hypothetical protein